MSFAHLMPREHGATVLLGASLLLGWFPEWSLRLEVLATVLAVLGLLFLREPLVRVLAGRAPADSAIGRRARALASGAGLVTVAAGAVVVYRVPLAGLAPLLVAGGCCFTVSVVTSMRYSAWRWWVDATGAAAAALPVPALRLATTGALDPVPYGACLIFYLGSTLHLRALLRDGPRMRRPDRMRPARAAWWSLAAVLAAAVAWAVDWLPAALAAPCAVALLRPLVMRGRVLEHYMRIGLSESLLTGLFVVATMVAATGLSPAGQVPAP